MLERGSVADLRDFLIFTLMVPMATEDVQPLHLRKRPAEEVELSIPSDTLAAIREVAATRDLSAESLMKLYIGFGLRQDVSRMFVEGDGS